MMPSEWLPVAVRTRSLALGIYTWAAWFSLVSIFGEFNPIRLQAVTWDWFAWSWALTMGIAGVVGLIGSLSVSFQRMVPIPKSLVVEAFGALFVGLMFLVYAASLILGGAPSRMPWATLIPYTIMGITAIGRCLVAMAERGDWLIRRAVADRQFQ